MRTRFIQPPYGPHLPDRLRNEGWWLDFSQQKSNDNDFGIDAAGERCADPPFEERKFHECNN